MIFLFSTVHSKYAASSKRRVRASQQHNAPRQTGGAIAVRSTWLRALTDHDGPFLDLATAHHAYEHGGADTLRAQTREQVIRMT